MGQLGKDFISGALDAIGGLINGAWDLLPWEAQWVLIGLLIVAVLFIANMLKNLGGWPLVATAALTVVAFISGAIGFHKGRKWAEDRKPAVAPRKKRKTLL